MNTKFLTVVLGCLLMAPLVNGQVYYSILVGTVRDATGAQIADAAIIANEVRTGVSTSAKTDDAGNYRIATLRPGIYSITATKANFKTKTLSDIELFVGVTTRIDIGLEVGDVVQKVSVEGHAPLVQTDSAERGIVMEHREIEALPLNERNIAELTYLVPGSVQGDVDGLGGRNQYFVDGGAATSYYQGVLVERVSVDTVQEFKVETALMTADRGLKAGAVISVATKQGTNQFHGVVYEFLRNNVLDARNFFARTPPPLRYNEFGGTLGGPVIKNKVFFQVNYEGSRVRESKVLIATMPSAAERAGNFTPGTGAKRTAAIYDPLSLDSAGLRTPFGNNQVPQSRMNPISLKYLAFWPAAQTSAAANNFNFNAPAMNDFDKFGIRADYNMREKDTFLFRYGHQNNPYLSPGSVPGAGTGVVGDSATGQTMIAGWNHVFSPRLFNEVRVSFVRHDLNSRPTDFYGQNMAKQLGFTNGDTAPQIIWSLPGVGFGGIPTSGVGGGSVFFQPNQTYFVQDDLSIIRGRHTFKTGLLAFRFKAQVYFASAGGVLQSFSGLYTSQINDLAGGQPFADFLLGALGGVSVVQSAEAAYYNRNFWQMYFMDDWKVSSRLTLQLGLRYDLNLPATSANGQSAAWIDGLDTRDQQTVVFPKNARGPLAAVLNGQPLGFPYNFSGNNWLWYPNWKNMQPRAGFAFRPFNDTKTVIRGGYGIFYDANTNASTTSLNFGRPFYVFSATPPPASQFTAPPYTFGVVPTLTVGFLPGQQFRSGYVSQPHWPDPRVQQWNLTIQRGIGHGIAVEGAYVGNHLGNGQTATTFNRLYPVGYTFHYDNGTSYTIQSSDALVRRQKYPLMARGTSALAWTHSTYEAAQFYVRKEFSNGLQVRAGYTRMHVYGSDGTWQDEWAAQSVNYQLSDNYPNIFFATYVYELPGQKLKGFLGAVLGGWRASGIINVASGPATYLYQGIPTIAGKTSSAELQPLLLHDPNLPSSQRTLQRWFDTSAFATPPPNSFGDLAATHAVRAPGQRNLNAGFAKIFRIRERQRLQFRGEFFNFFNHPQFGQPAATNGLSNFGQITSANPARQVQLGLKYDF